MESRRAYIYKITNPKGAVYIGSTINLYDRMYRYKTCRLSGQYKIKNSILKYGWESHSFDVLLTCDEKYRYKYESLYGLIYNSISKGGLNLSLPKSDSLIECMSDSTKKKIGDKHKGKIIGEAQRKSMSIALKKTFSERGHPAIGRKPWNKGIGFLKGDKNPMYGVKRSDEWKAIHSERMKKINPSGDKHKASRIVLDTYTGVFYYSLRELCLQEGINYSTLKSKLNGSYKNNTRYMYA